MKFNRIVVGKKAVVEIISDDIIIKNTQDVLDLIGNLESDSIILHSHNFDDDFYDLSTLKLGEILQKFTNYRVKVAIIGNFDKYPSRTLKEFIYESNKFGNYLFFSSIDDVIKKWQ